MSDRRALISCIHLQRRFADFRPEFEDRGVDVILPQVDQQLTEDWLLDRIADIDAVIAGDDPFSATVLRRGRRGRLRVLVKWGIGMDAIDRDAAEELGIDVVNTPGMFADEVADVALGYLIMAARQLHVIDRGVRAGKWPKPVGSSLAGRGLGVVGLGSIGRAVAKRGLAVGMRVRGFDPSQEVSTPAGVTRVPLRDVLTASDFLVLACALTGSNRHMLDSDALSVMPPGSHVINVARGALIDESALVAALEDGHVASAALDVFEHEPLPADSPLRRFSQCVFGSHNASNTAEAVERVNRVAVDELFRLTGW